MAAATLLAAAPSHAQRRDTTQVDGQALEDAPDRIARRHLLDHRAEMGLTAEDLDDPRERRYRSRKSGTTHVHLRQRVRGIEVSGGDLGMAVDAGGRVVSTWSRFAPNAAARVNTETPLLDASAAIAAAAEALGVVGEAPSAPLLDERTADRRMRFPPGSVSRDEIPVHLAYVKGDGELRLAWSLVLRTPDGRHWWDVRIDATSGELLERSDWMARETYRVYPLPLDSPDEGPRTLEVDVADTTASPFGWHDTDGIAGAEFTDTRGNNVTAQEDQDGNDGVGAKPDGGASLVFDFPIDFAQPPSAYVDAATTNLFYWNNISHDLFYQYGFDEASGNFQENNYGKGGTGGDSVDADCQDGSDTNNAQFGTPPEGSNPRMEMFVFTGVGARVDVSTPASIADLYQAGSAAFGPAVGISGTMGTVVQALDPADVDGPSTTDACSALTNGGAVSGNIAILDRGSCNFTIKVKNAQDAGAIAAIVVNDQGDDVITMGGSDPTITIPSLFIGQSDGATIVAELGSGVTANLRTLQDRDSSLDSGIIIHEYAHGVTNRLTGGAANVGCLDFDQPRSMGEGWSDYFALAFTAKTGGAGSDARELGTYVLGNPSGPGIRTHPYTTDLVENPLTFIDVETRVVPHAVGTVWATALWEAYWELTDAYGFDADLYAGDGGNNLAIQLVMDALELQPCEPTFIEARDAVLQADTNLTSSANECYLWRAFAKRGMGPTASISTNPDDLRSVVEDFTLPAQCDDFCGDGTTDPAEECDDGNRIPGDGCAADCMTEASHTFSGTAAGGSVTLVIEGVMLVVTTTAGESAAQVAANVAAAINADATLQGLGVTATSIGDTFHTTGSIDQITIQDSGLAPPVPAAPLAAPLLPALLLLAGARVLRRRGRAADRTLKVA